MFSKRKTIICREGWYYLLVLAFVFTGSILREVNLLMLMSGMMLFPFLFNWRSAVGGLRRLEIRRRMPSSITAGDLLVVNVELKKRPGRHLFGLGSSWAVQVEDQVSNESAPGAVASQSARLFFWRIQPGQSQRSTYRARLHRRGRYRMGPAVLSTGFPFGLVRHNRTTDTSDSIIVLPRSGRLTQSCTDLYRHSHAGTHSSRHKHAMQDGDFHSLRDWRPGDGRRWIHWRTTARRGIPIVRQFEQHREQDLALLLDLWQPAEATKQDEQIVEQTVSFAATVVTDVCRRANSYLHLGTTGSDAISQGGAASTGLMQDLLEQLAVAEPHSIDNLSELLAKTLDAIRPGMTMLIVSPRHIDVEQLESDTQLWSHPQRRSAAARIATIHSGGDELAQYFEMPL